MEVCKEVCFLGVRLCGMEVGDVDVDVDDDDAWLWVLMSCALGRTEECRL